MSLNKASIAAITVASIIAAGAVANEVIGGIALGTPNAYYAEVVLRRFNSFTHKNQDNTALIVDEDFSAVVGFVKNPRGAKLVARPKNVDMNTREVTSWSYTLITEDGCLSARPGSVYYTGWKAVKADKVLYGTLMQGLKEGGCIFDWEAVNQFLKDHET